MQGSSPDSPPSRTGVAVFLSNGASGPSKKLQTSPEFPFPLILSNLDRFISSRLSTGTALVAWGFWTTSNVAPSPPALQHPIRCVWGGSTGIFLGSGTWDLGPSPTPESPVRNEGISEPDSSLQTRRADGLFLLNALSFIVLKYIFTELNIFNLNLALNTYLPTHLPTQSGPRTAARGGTATRQGEERHRTGIGPCWEQ